MMRDDERASASRYLPLRETPEESVPLLRGPDIVTEGYYELESLERQAALEAMRQHPTPVALWYRALTLYYRGITGQFDFSDVADDTTWLLVRNLQAQLLGLGISSAKSSLDALLVGYYSVAFAAIRHMIESIVLFHYVNLRPIEALLWYDEGAPHQPRKTPACRKMIDALKVASGDDHDQRMEWERIYGAWDSMSKGTHPTGEGLYQTVGVVEGKRFVIGPTYDRQLCLIAFDHGLWAVDGLLNRLSKLRVMDVEWQSGRALLKDSIARCREDWHAEQRPTAV